MKLFAALRDNRDGEELVHRFTPMMIGKLLRYGADYHTAEHLSQQTWLRILQNKHQLRDPSRFPAWLFTILHSEWVQHCNKMRPASSFYSPRIASEETDPLETLLERERTAVLLRAMATMDEKFRQPCDMFYMQGKKIREITAVLDIPEGTVKRRLFECRRRLRRAMEDAGIFAEDFG